MYIYHFSANISLNTNTRVEDVLMISDKNESTCLNVTRPNVTPSLIAELNIVASSESVPDQYIVTEIMMNGLECNTSVVFDKVEENNCQMKKTNGEVGKLLSAVPNTNMCYHKLPVECDVGYALCKFEGVLAVHNPEEKPVEICEIQLQ